jgi:DnaJ family protein C protein 28
MSRNIDDILNQAMENGDFDNLPGAGKPLNLNNADSHGDPTWKLAHRIMKENEIVPPWIAEKKDIQQKLEAARGKLRKAWEWRKSAPVMELAKAEAHWQRAQDTFRMKVDALNKRIFDFNLSTTILSQHMLPIRAEREIEKIVKE